MTTRESVTILFTDLVASTAVFSGLSADEASGLRSIHFDGLGQAVTLAGGQVVKNLGDGVMAVFTTLSAAVDARSPTGGAQRRGHAWAKLRRNYSGPPAHQR